MVTLLDEFNSTFGDQSEEQSRDTSQNDSSQSDATLVDDSDMLQEFNSTFAKPVAFKDEQTEEGFEPPDVEQMFRQLYLEPKEPVFDTKIEATKDVGKGIFEFGRGLAGMAVTFPTHIINQVFKPWQMKVTRNVMKDAPPESINQFEQLYGYDPRMTDQEIQDRVQQEAGRLDTLIGGERTTKTGQALMQPLEDIFGVIHEAFSSGVDFVIDKDKHPNLHGSVTGGVEGVFLIAFGAVLHAKSRGKKSAINTVVDEYKTKGKIDPKTIEQAKTELETFVKTEEGKDLAQSAEAAVKEQQMESVVRREAIDPTTRKPKTVDQILKNLGIEKTPKTALKSPKLKTKDQLKIERERPRVTKDSGVQLNVGIPVDIMKLPENVKKVFAKIPKTQLFRNKEAWKETGYWVAKDGKARFWLPINKKNIKLETLKEEPINIRRLEDIVQEPKLYEAVPELKDYRIVFDKDAKNPCFNIERKRITIVPDTKIEQVYGTLHELQHAINQTKELSSGTSINHQKQLLNVKLIESTVDRLSYDGIKPETREYAQTLSDKMKEFSTTEIIEQRETLNTELKNLIALEPESFYSVKGELNTLPEYSQNQAIKNYFFEPGEMEARTTEIMESMTPKELAKEAPWEILDQHIKEIAEQKPSFGRDSLGAGRKLYSGIDPTLVTEPIKKALSFVQKDKVMPEYDSVSKQGRAINILRKAAKTEDMSFVDYLEGLGYSREQAYKFDEIGSFHEIKKQVGNRKTVDKNFPDVVLEQGLREHWSNPHHREFFNWMMNEGAMLNPYDGSGKAPKFVKPVIPKELPKPLEGKDLSVWDVGQSPHYQASSVYGLNDNFVYDYASAQMAYQQNIGNQMKWAKDIVNKVKSKGSTKELNKALEPYQKKIDNRMSDAFQSQERIDLRQTKINKMRKGKARDDLKKIQGDEKARTQHLFEKINIEMEEARQKVIPKLAEKHSDIRTVLEAAGELPEGIKLSSKEKLAANDMRKFFESAKEELIANEIPVIEEGNYMPNLWKAATSGKEFSRTFMGRKKLPSLLSFQHKVPGSKLLYPDMKAILDHYIPTVNKKLAYQPYLDRWTTAVADMPPRMKDYYTSWARKNLTPDRVTLANKIGNVFIAAEYLRTIGFSFRVAVKHAMKSHGTIAELGFLRTGKNATKTARVAVDAARQKLGWEQTPAVEQRLIDSYYSMRHIIETLEGGGFEGTKHLWKTLPGSLTSFVEYLENGSSVLATIETGMKKGMDYKTTYKKVWETIMDANFRLGPDEPIWRKGNTAMRAMTFFVNTPFKMLEHKKKIIKQAVLNEKDNFGTSGGKKLLRMIAALGLAEAIARANNTSIISMALHGVHPHTIMEASEDVLKGVGEGLVGDHGELIRTFPQINNVYKLYQNTYNPNYYDGSLKSFLGFQKLNPGTVDTKKKRSRAGRGNRTRR